MTIHLTQMEEIGAIDCTVTGHPIQPRFAQLGTTFSDQDIPVLTQESEANKVRNRFTRQTKGGNACLRT